MEENKQESEINNKAYSRLSLIQSQLSNHPHQVSKTTKSIKKSPDETPFDGFYKKTLEERHAILQKLVPELDFEKITQGGLDTSRAESMVENCIGIISLPVGLGLNFLVNGKKYSVPMALEEPSVIAAASSIAKLVSQHGGFFATYSQNPTMMGQIHIVDTNTDDMLKFFEEQEEQLLNIANTYCQRMVQRGGGARNVRLRILKEGINDGIVSIDIFVNVCDSMGANLINTVSEGVSAYLHPLIPSGKIIMKILSNLTRDRMVSAEFKIPVKDMAYKGLSGEEICNRVLKAYEIACIDKYRAATHNKGIMNGIDAVAVALGQDWRAIEAGCHAFASISYSKKDDEYNFDEYKPLTFYNIIEIKDKKFLYGCMKIPMALGVVGGAIQSNPVYSNLFKILGNPNSSELAGIMASVGLANNLAAIRAIVSTGIQQGHMGLHAKNVAIRAGIPDSALAEVVEYMKSTGKINEDAAREFLNKKIKTKL